MSHQDVEELYKSWDFGDELLSDVAFCHEYG